MWYVATWDPNPIKSEMKSTSNDIITKIYKISISFNIKSSDEIKLFLN